MNPGIVNDLSFYGWTGNDWEDIEDRADGDSIASITTVKEHHCENFYEPTAKFIGLSMDRNNPTEVYSDDGFRILAQFYKGPHSLSNVGVHYMSASLQHMDTGRKYDLGFHLDINNLWSYGFELHGHYPTGLYRVGIRPKDGDTVYAYVDVVPPGGGNASTATATPRPPQATPTPTATPRPPQATATPQPPSANDSFIYLPMIQR